MKHRTTLSQRLIIYFLTVMLVPFVIFVSFYLVIGEKPLRIALDNQAEMLIEAEAENLQSLIDEYRHKSYQAAINGDIRATLESGVQPQGEAARRIYSVIYSIMSGDTYLASLSIVSLDGNVRISTHSFPEKYDLRIHSNAWDDTNILSIAERNAYKDQQWFLSITDHRIENGQQVAFSLLRRIDNLGFAIIDVYMNALPEELGNGGFFSDIILVDNSVYQAFSLLHTQHFGSFSEFPALSNMDNLAVRPIAGTNLVIVGAMSMDMAETSLRSSLLFLMISLASGICISVLLTFIFSRSISKRFTMISTGMKQFEQGDFNTKLETTGIYEFDRLSLAFNTMVKRIETLVARQREEEAKTAEAERKALESQMNPHFLFNTLSTIKALARLHGEEQIYTIAVRLGKLLRYSVNNHTSDDTIKESLDLAESYLMIQKIRFGERLSYTINCEKRLQDILIPRLIIQPLAENAIIHGLEGKTGDWELSIEVKEVNKKLLISVKDNGIGFKPSEKPEDLVKEGHTGLYNIRRRLELRYGSSFTFNIDSEEGKGTEAIIILPIKEGNR